MSTSQNNYKGWYLDDYEFEYINSESTCNTLVITTLENSKIISLYTDKRSHLHAIVKEQPYLQYRPINITVKVQDCPDVHKKYFTEVNNDFNPDDILLVVPHNDRPSVYIYKDMECEYWKKDQSILSVKNYLSNFL